MISDQVERLAGADHVLMSEMQRRVAELTGIPVHGNDAVAESGGGKTRQKTMRFRSETDRNLVFFG